jgi:hypothetical protein
VQKIHTLRWQKSTTSAKLPEELKNEEDDKSFARRLKLKKRLKGKVFYDIHEFKQYDFD